MLASACPAVPTAAPMVGAAGHYFNAAAAFADRPTNYDDAVLPKPSTTHSIA
jgi:hypothetical protein